MAKDAEPSSHSSFRRFERVLKALMAVPKTEAEEKAGKHQRKARRRKLLKRTG